jgi:hypothetical protein
MKQLNEWGKFPTANTQPLIKIAVPGKCKFGWIR